MMTVLSGFLLLLCVSVCQALLGDTVGHPVPIRKIFENRKRDISIPGVETGCYKDFRNYKFDNWKTIDKLPRVKTVYECNVACDERKDCKVFMFTQEFGHRSGCTLAKEHVRGLISPIKSRSVNCRFRNCTKRDFTYSREHKIFLKDDAGPIAQTLGVSYDECHARCRNHTGKNGFPFDKVHWGLTYYTLKDQFPNKKIPCGFTTYHFKDSVVVGTCKYFATGAVIVHVKKIVGPTTECRNAREAKMKKQLNDSNHRDYGRFVLSKNDKLAHYPYTVFPQDCYNDCYHFSGCQKFLVVHGMLNYSGCWLFPSYARKQYSLVKSGKANCNSSACLTRDAAYGKTFEIVLKPEYALKESGIWKCQQFCANHSGLNSGFPHHELDWDNTGGAIEPARHWHECVGFTYTAYSTWFDKKCMIFGRHATQLKIVKRYGTVPQS